MGVQVFCESLGIHRKMLSIVKVGKNQRLIPYLSQSEGAVHRTGINLCVHLFVIFENNLISLF